MPMTLRETWVSRSVIAGCFQCNGSDALWTSPNAQGVAARHHDATGHTTWADVNLSIRYGDKNKDERTETKKVESKNDC